MPKANCEASRNGTRHAQKANPNTRMKTQVIVWNEYRHERKNAAAAALYPRGIHEAIAEPLRALPNHHVRTATLDEPEHGLSQETLDATDVLIWWGHNAHNEVDDTVVKRVQRRVLEGMGLIVLHSAHHSKLFKALMGTHCSLKWREATDKERLWVVNPAHPIAAGLPEHFELPAEEMYGEPFGIPEPNQLIFISWFTGGEVFRSGATWQRGNGHIFYFRPGHETYPSYYNPHVQRVIANAVIWARPTVRIADSAPRVEPLEPLPQRNNIPLLLLTLLGFGMLPIQAAENNTVRPTLPVYKKIVLADKFYAEGSHYGDFNKDGILDVVAGPYWYEGGDFTRRHEIFPPETFDPEKYSDNFLAFGVDINGDSWDDVFVCPQPGTTGYWYKNPKGKSGHWEKHLFANEISNETQWWIEVLKGKGPGLLYNRDGYLGFTVHEVKNGEPKWTFYPVSKEDKRRFEKYTHGIGCGDINGNGRIDIVEKEGWWEQPQNSKETPWKFHKYKFAMAAAQMHVFDVDGDGLNDIVTAWHCHLYGLVWHKQIRDEKGTISWKRNEILPIKPDLTSPALRISQMHSLAVADINGDGLPDLITGKRYWAHGSNGDREALAPATLYWFELKRDGKGAVSFIPHKIDDDSGVGTQVTAKDLNNDCVPDIITSNKKGSFLFLSVPQK
jgi:trehalose utilization protein